MEHLQHHGAGEDRVEKHAKEVGWKGARRRSKAIVMAVSQWTTGERLQEAHRGEQMKGDGVRAVEEREQHEDAATTEEELVGRSVPFE